MNIKIKCKVTVERLTEAIAILKLQNPDFSCTLDGVLEITLDKAQAQAPTQDLPELADEPTEATLAFSREFRLMQNEREAAAERGEYPDERWAIEHRKYIAKKHKSEENRIEQARREKVFSEIAKKYGDDFINALNAEIADVWREARPQYPHKGKWGDKGTFRPVPVIKRFGNGFYIFSGPENGASKKIHTPLSATDRSDGLADHWKYPEWVELVVPRLEHVINEYEKAITNS